MASVQHIYQHLWWVFPFTLVNIQVIHHFSNVIDVQFNLHIGIANDAIINYGLLSIITVYLIGALGQSSYRHISFCLGFCWSSRWFNFTYLLKIIYDFRVNMMRNKVVFDITNLMGSLICFWIISVDTGVYLCTCMQAHACASWMETSSEWATCVF